MENKGPENFSQDLIRRLAPHKFCFENQRRILSIHSGPQATEIFRWSCIQCDGWYKKCMFVRRGLCRWCFSTPNLTTQNLAEQESRRFKVHHHIHCYSKEKSCEEPYFLTLISQPALRYLFNWEAYPPRKIQNPRPSWNSQHPDSMASIAQRTSFISASIVHPITYRDEYILTTYYNAPQVARALKLIAWYDARKTLACEFSIAEELLDARYEIVFLKEGYQGVKTFKEREDVLAQRNKMIDEEFGNLSREQKERVLAEMNMTAAERGMKTAVAFWGNLPMAARLRSPGMKEAAELAEDSESSEDEEEEDSLCCCQWCTEDI